MYPQYSDARFPPEYGPTQAPMPVDPASGGQRYAYGDYYGSKALENSQFGAVGGSVHRQGYGGKPGSMAAREGMYPQGWVSAMPGPGYGGGGAPGSSKQALTKGDYPFAMQSDVYPGAAAAGTPPQGYPDSLHPPGMGGGGFPAAGYHGAHPPGFSPGGQFPPFGSRGGIPHHPAMMHGAAEMHGSHGNIMDGYPESMRSGMHGAAGMSYSPGSAQWRSPGRAAGSWNQDPSQGGSSWSPYPPPPPPQRSSTDGYPSSGPSTPNQPPPPPPPPPSSSSSSQQGGNPSTPAAATGQTSTSQGQLYRQQSQPSFAGALSPQTPYGSNPDLRRHGSVSSLRDALLATTPSTTLQPPPSQQQQPYSNSPRVLAEHMASPLTPSAADPLTPASAGGHPLSPPLRQPSFVAAPPAERQDSQASSSGADTPTADLLNRTQRQNSELSARPPSLGGLVTSGEGGGGGGANQLPVEDILGIKNNSPVVDSISSPGSLHEQQQSHAGARQANSVLARGGGLHSPRRHGEGKARSKEDSDGVNSVDGGGVVAGRPDSLGFQASSPSLATQQQQHSPLVAAGKTNKARKLPLMSPVDRNHPSVLNQYSFCEDSQRKEFLDALFTLLEKEGVPLVRLPTICKAPLDLFRVFNSVQELGGFVNVAEKRLWREVLKSFNLTATNPNSGALRTLQQYYVKLLLPYECYVKKLSVAQCLSKLDRSLALQSSNSPRSEKGALLNHDEFDSKGEGVSPQSLDLLSAATVNGDAASLQHNSNERLSKRLDSQGSSDGSSLMQEPPLSTPSQDFIPPSQPTAGGNSKQDNEDFDLPVDGSQDYSEDIASAEPLPEMSVQDTESILGISSYASPGAAHQDPSTPSAVPPSHNAPSPSYPPPRFPPSHPHQAPAATPTPSGPQPSASAAAAAPEFIDAMDIGSGTGPPPGMGSGQHSGSAYPYPPPMDAAVYAHSPSHMTPGGYPPYGVPSQYDFPAEFQHPGMLRPPYHPSGAGGGAGSPYGIPPAMQMHSHRMMDYPPGHYRSPVGMPQGSPMSLRDVPPYPGGSLHPPPPPPPGMSAASEWHWQQQRAPRMLSSLPPHLHSSYSALYQQQQQQRALQQQQLSARSHHHQQQQQAAAAAAAAASIHQQQQQQQLMLQHRANPAHHHPPGPSPSSSSMGAGQNHEALRIQWQEQQQQLLAKSSAARLLGGEKGRGLHRPGDAPPDGKTAAGHKMDHHHQQQQQQQQQQDGLKRMLPDWAGCVEGTKPKLVKRRRLYQNDCGHVEPWRVMMSLKSGLLSESTWALDTLNILLHDDRTIGFFYLKHHHSLLNTLVDHFKVILNAIFGDILETMDAYYHGNEGAQTKQRSVDGEKAREEMYNAKWLAEASTDDHTVLSDLAKSADRELSKTDDSSDPRSERENDRVQKPSRCYSTQSIPIATVFSAAEMKLGRSDALSHVQLCVGSEDMYFPSGENDRKMMPAHERKQLEAEFKLQRIDQTSIADLLHREALQLPLNRYGRLGRSPRRRERSFLEELKRRESLTRSEEDHSSTSLGGKDGGEAESRAKGCVAALASSSEAPPTKTEAAFANFPGSCPMYKEESEIHQKEQLPHCLIPPSRDMLKARCVCISNILRSLSFIPGNDLEFSQHSGILIILGCLLALHHHHLIQQQNRKLARPSFLRERAPGDQDDDDAIDTRPEEKHFGYAEDHWWWECLDILRENTLVILSNISGQLDFSIFPESITFPIIDGLLHWSVCPSAQATDPLPDVAMVSSLSPQRLVLETLAKISISEVNVDYILATPPLPQLDLLFSHLIRFIGQKKHPVVRQFALVLLSNLAQGSEAASRLIGQQKMVVSLLLGCIESSEHASCSSQGQLVGGYNPEDPNSLSVAMLRRAAAMLHCLAKIPANRTAFLRYRDRTLYLATSQYVEPSVSSILMDMLFELGKL